MEWKANGSIDMEDFFFMLDGDKRDTELEKLHLTSTI